MEGEANSKEGTYKGGFPKPPFLSVFINHGTAINVYLC